MQSDFLDHKNTNGYVSAVGIQSIASQQVENHFLITPYGAYPVALVNLPVGLVWYHAMLSGSRMQGTSYRQIYRYLVFS
jgi:hypothetical protein